MSPGYKVKVYPRVGSLICFRMSVHVDDRAVITAVHTDQYVQGFSTWWASTERNGFIGNWVFRPSRDSGYEVEVW